MKRLYLALTVIGYLASNWFVVLVSLRTGNLLLWTRPLETKAGMFANPIASAFAIDLLLAALVAEALPKLKRNRASPPAAQNTQSLEAV